MQDSMLTLRLYQSCGMSTARTLSSKTPENSAETSRSAVQLGRTHPPQSLHRQTTPRCDAPLGPPASGCWHSRATLCSMLQSPQAKKLLCNKKNHLTVRPHSPQLKNRNTSPKTQPTKTHLKNPQRNCKKRNSRLETHFLQNE
jgi:hypothetical protein